MNPPSNARGIRMGRVIAARESLVTISSDGAPITKNEVGYVLVGDQRLKAEVLRIRGHTADMQVFEDTSGCRVGDKVELTGELLSVELGPGILGSVFDGLQNPLHGLAEQNGFFLPRGVYLDPLDRRKKWRFNATASIGDLVSAGMPLGNVSEGKQCHKIMVPFNEPEDLEVSWIREGNYTVDEPVARLRRSGGEEIEVTLIQRWPVRIPIPARMFARNQAERLFPYEPMTTTTRIIDTFFPIARGGTGCIPGPFGAGKTVLQSLISRFSTVDVVVIVACGERAGEVVESLTELPKTKDPKTGGSLMDRTVIICNTSSMPVAARESSIYTGVTLGEYYRQMGLHVLLIADSTSRWAQAMRETSGRMEEIPGEDAFPAYLDSSIKTLYERAGAISCPDGSEGSLTMIGTVSPPGGNFEEPVTRATLATVKAFLGLSYDRAYRRFYPAIDPLISWSRYLDQLQEWFHENLRHGWTADVKRMLQLLHDGDAVYQMMQVTGEEGVSLEDYILWQKSTLLDRVFLQQDAFDPVDMAVPRERQLAAIDLLKSVIDRQYDFSDKDDVRIFFTHITGLFRNWNYASAESPDFLRLPEEIQSAVDARATHRNQES